MVADKYFSLGLSYYDIMDLPENELRTFLSHCSRLEIIDWLMWNDRNGVYSDESSLREFGQILEKEEGIEIIVKMVLNA